MNRSLLSGKDDEAQKWIEFFKEIFDEFYIEVQRNGVKESEDLVEKQMELAKKNDLEVVATCDVHYLEKEDWKIQEIAWCIRDGVKLADQNREKAWSQEFYVKSPEEMYDLFKDHPEVVSNSQKIADSIEEFDITFERVQPEYKDIPTGKTAKEVLRELSFKGAEARYGKVKKELEDRINYELEIIHNKGYDDYFLVVYDYVKWAEENGIIVGPGRGSGAGSVVSYSLGITKIDPISWNLLFERFLNPQRPSPPDFDIDFEDDRRDELFKYMEKTYGSENTSFIGTFGRLKTRAAIRDVARVMGIDLAVADRLSKMVTIKFGRVHTIDKMMGENAEFREAINSAPELQELSTYVKKLENVARHLSTHACGFLVTPEPIVNYVPVQRETKGGDKVITQIEGYPLEPMGLMKFDFLGLANLSIIKRALERIEETKGEKIDIEKIDLKDQKTFEVFQKAETVGIFQFESGGMRKYLKDLRPTDIEDLIFMNAAYRPGPMDYINDYIARKYGKQKTTYLHPDLEPILKTTYGFAIYQEQVIEIAVKVAGYNLGEADILRRAMGKKKPEVMAEEKAKFMDGAIKQGYKKEVAEAIFAYLEPFADYGFNRSHSACYSLIAYQTAYLKAHYPIEFLAGLMETDLANADKIKRDMEEAHRMKVKVLPPDVNASNVNFTIAGNDIRFGLAAIKNIGKKEVEFIVKERIENGPFANLDDLIERVGTNKLSKKTLEFLAMSGALDEFGGRKALLAAISTIFERVSKSQSHVSAGQTGIFQTSSGTIEKMKTPLPEIEPETEAEKVAWERELLGTFFSTHPLKPFASMLLGRNVTSITDARTRTEGANVEILAMVTKVKTIFTKKDAKPMAFVTIEDLTDNAEAVIFNGVYEANKDLLRENLPILIKGTVSFRRGDFSILINEINEPKQVSTFEPREIKIDISMVSDSDKLSELKKTIVNNPGDSTVVILYKAKDGTGVREIRKKVDLRQEVIKIFNGFIV